MGSAVRGRHLAVSDRFVGKPLLALLDPAEAETRPAEELPPVFGLVGRDGLSKVALPVTADVLRSLYAEMVEARCFDEAAKALLRQGLLPRYTSVSGEEALQIGAATHLRPGDWVAATQRDSALVWRGGLPWKMVYLWCIGGSSEGQALADVNILPLYDSSISLAMHAVGLALSEKIKGSDRIALASLGPEASMAGHNYQAITIAVAHQVPAVFFHRSSAAAPTEAGEGDAHTLADMSEALGMPGVRVDGRDVVAVSVTVQEACERARRGDGPSLIEAVMDHGYRHRNTTDPDRRSAEQKRLEEGDPVERVRRLLQRAGAWTREWQSALERTAFQGIREAAAWALKTSHPVPGEAIDERRDASTSHDRNNRQTPGE